MKGEFKCIIATLQNGNLTDKFFIHNFTGIIGIVKGYDEYGREAQLNTNVIPFLVVLTDTFIFVEKYSTFKETTLK